MKFSSLNRSKLIKDFEIEVKATRGKKSARNTISIVKSLYAWMRREGLRLSDFTQKDIESFIQCPSGKERAYNTTRTIRRRLKIYFRWLEKNDLSKIKTKDLFPISTRGLPRRPLTDEARRFLESNASNWKPRTVSAYRHAIYHLYDWFLETGLCLEKLAPTHLDQFPIFLKQSGLQTLGIRSIHIKVKVYLSYLHAQGYVKYAPEIFFPPRRLMGANFDDIKLPEHTTSFFSLLNTTLRPSTVQHYETALRHLYRFMELRGLGLETLQRIELEEWMAELKSRGLAASTRQQIIVSVRIYFYWLYEHSYIDVEPDAFVKFTDIPKRPKYLPRPIPPSIDQEIIRRLTTSEDICHKGLLLMRFTGIRIGELTALPFNCILDGRGYHFLKVPLGKLNNERTVRFQNTNALRKNPEPYKTGLRGRKTRMAALQ